MSCIENDKKKKKEEVVKFVTFSSVPQIFCQYFYHLNDCTKALWFFNDLQ